ncbi:MAG: hypothetical protein KDE20_22100, partial [Caldilineaceae bacterium]|nr:hypothetical protein [Caldilineaceae bacterium]
PLALTAVAYPNFSSTNVTMSSAQFTFLLPTGTVISPAIPNPPASGAFNDITGVWTVKKITPTVWGAAGQDPNDLQGNDVYQVTLQNAPEIVTTSGTAIQLFSFQLPSDCSGGDVQVLTNDNSIQQALLGVVGNINNQMSMRITAPADDIYVGNNPAAASFACPLNGDPDGDNDGVPDTIDSCPNTPAGGVVGAGGCPFPTDLSVSKSASVTVIEPGIPFNYTLNVGNNGAEAHNVVLVDNVPPGLTIQGAPIASDGGVVSVNGQTVTVTWPILADGATPTVTITVVRP